MKLFRSVTLALLVASAPLALAIPPANATISNEAAQVTINGNGATTAFDYNFLIPDQYGSTTPAVGVFLTNTTTHVTTPLILGTDYTIAGVGNPNGGTVTYPVSGSPLAAGNTITIQRALNYTQPTVVMNQAFYPHTVEQVADWQELQIQQIAAALEAPSASSQLNGSSPETITGAWTFTQGVMVPDSTAFWTNAGAVPISRLPARLFGGAASLNDGSSDTDLDWLGDLKRAGTLPDDELDYAQNGFLTNPDSAPGGMATPLIAVLAAANTTNSRTNSTPRALEALAINNAPVGQNPAIWSFYHECHEVSGTGNCFADENEVRNIRGVQLAWTPYALNGGAINLSLGCGAGLTAVGQFNCAVAEYIQANPMPYTAGISFLPGSVVAVGGLSPAIQLPANYAVEWWGSGNLILADMYSDTVGNVDIITGAGKMVFVGNGGSVNLNDTKVYEWGNGSAYVGGNTAGATSTQYVNFFVNGAEQGRWVNGGLAVGSTSAGVYREQVTGTLNVTSTYYANGTAGVSCSGTPTSSFASVNGIVTHC